MIDRTDSSSENGIEISFQTLSLPAVQVATINGIAAFRDPQYGTILSWAMTGYYFASNTPVIIAQAVAGYTGTLYYSASALQQAIINNIASRTGWVFDHWNAWNDSGGAYYDAGSFVLVDKKFGEQYDYINNPILHIPLNSMEGCIYDYCAFTSGLPMVNPLHGRYVDNDTLFINSYVPLTTSHGGGFDIFSPSGMLYGQQVKEDGQYFFDVILVANVESAGTPDNGTGQPYVWWNTNQTEPYYIQPITVRTNVNGGSVTYLIRKFANDTRNSYGVKNGSADKNVQSNDQGN